MNSKTVAELIETLSKHPPNMPVVIFWDSGWCAISDAQIAVQANCRGGIGYDVLEIDVADHGSFEP